MAPIVYPVQSEKKVSAVSSKRRSSVDLNVSHNTDEIFDYDTSDSIEEEEEEVETAAEEEEFMDPGNVSVKSGRSRKSVINDSEDEKSPKKVPNRSSRRSIGGRYSNITMESSLGGAELEKCLGLTCEVYDAFVCRRNFCRTLDCSFNASDIFALLSYYSC